MTFDHSLDQKIATVARNTAKRDMESEDWQKAVALSGLLAIKDNPYRETVHEIIDRSIETQTSAGQLSYGSLDPRDRPDYTGEWYTRHRRMGHQVNPASLGPIILEFYERTRQEYYLDAARKQYEYLRNAERVDGAIPQHKDGELWLDSAYMICPFLVRYGAVQDDSDAFTEATNQVKVLTTHLRDQSTSLFRHTWKETPNSHPQSTFWSRGNGWLLTGIVDMLAYLPDEFPDRGEIVETFRDTAGAILDLQDASGYWHNTLDDPETALEASGTLMFAYAFKEGYDRGLLEDDAFVEAARDAVKVSSGAITEAGDVRRVSIPPGGPNAPLGVTSYGQGWFLLAATRFTE